MDGTLPVQEFTFKTFELETLKKVLGVNLKKYFERVEVKVVECPDLSTAPYNLAAPGFGGGFSGIIDLGGVPYLEPLVDRSKVYKMEDIVTKSIGTEDFPNGWYLSGPAAGPFPSQGVNSEMILNMMIGKDGKLVKNKSKVALIKPGGGVNGSDVIVKDLVEETRCALLANLLVSSGTRGKVLEIKCGKRISMDVNFTGSLRKALIKDFGTEPIGLGGLFLVRDSPTYIHVMPDFSTTPLNSDEDVSNWLQYFYMDPPTMYQSVLVSSDPGLDLRVEHSHGWNISNNNEVAGHYHHDNSPDTVEYIGYYTLAQKLYRIDRPKVTHDFGRD